MDILLSGRDSTNNRISKIYKNNLPDSSGFSEQAAIILEGVENGSVAWGDYDNDGDLDILLTGESDDDPISKIYKNNGNNTFSLQLSINLTGVSGSSTVWGDYNNDGKLDILLTGRDNFSNYISKIYKNNSPTTHSSPTYDKFSIIQSVVLGNTATLSWNKFIDNMTPDSALCYNLYIDTISKGVGINSPMANVADGCRLIARFGNIQDTIWTIHNLDTGKYYWSVQAIDRNLAGSDFHKEDSFMVSFTASISPLDNQVLWPAQNGTQLKVNETELADSRQWKYSLFPGGPYSNDITDSIETTYIPNFPLGSYYVVCVSTLSGISVTSNEVKIEVLHFSEQTEIDLKGVSKSSVSWGDYDNDNDLDILLTGSYNSLIYKNKGDNTFKEQTSISLTGINDGSAAWGDYNNDGNLDILLAGIDGTGSCISKIYKNNGDSTFAEQTDFLLIGLNESSVAWSDFNRDGHLDCILAGKDQNGEAYTKIYWNLNNNFIDAGIYLKGGQTLDIADYNKDNYPDILISGEDINSISHTTIYKNNGNNTFTEQVNIDLIDLAYSCAVWGDYNYDGNLDILLTGNGIPKIYKNNSDNSFTEQTDIILANASAGSADWGDYDNDGDLDILLTGSYLSKIYKNNAPDSSGYNEQTDIAIAGIQYSSAAWGDYNNDGNLDFIIAGSAKIPVSQSVSKIYKRIFPVNSLRPDFPLNLRHEIKNNQAFLYWDPASDANTPSQSLSYNVRIGSSPGASDIVFPLCDTISGFNKISGIGNAYLNNEFVINNLDTGTYYWSVQTINNSFLSSDFSDEQSFTIHPTFTEQTSLEGVFASSVDWGDYDNDGDLDILLTGDNVSANLISKIYKNNGDSTFPEQIDIALTGVYLGSATWGDYDNDNDLDILLSGSTAHFPYYSPVTKIYKNNSPDSSGFIEQTNITLSGVMFSSLAWGDYDNDGDLDILLSGTTNSYATGAICKIYRNDGDSLFTEQSDISITGVYKGSVAWGDYNNDGYLDILLTGSDVSDNLNSKIYKNNATDSPGFTEQSDIVLQKVTNSSVAWGDYDNDGDLDILLTGRDNNYDPVLNIYRNDGNNNFININTDLRKVTASSVAWGDYDNDGYLDILISGSSGNKITRIYKNNKNGTFTDINQDITGVDGGSLAWADYNNDGDLDILLTGTTNTGATGATCKIYNNNTNYTNYLPAPPKNLHFELLGFNIKLIWSKVIDTNCIEGSLYYNMRVGTTPGAFDIVSPMANISGGYRNAPDIGNAQCDTFWFIKNLVPMQTYYWSVQAIDQSFTGGIWAEEKAFTITVIQADLSADTVCYGDSTHFIDQTFTAGESIIAWSWDFSDGNTSTLQNPVHLYSQSGGYNVKLKVFSASYVDSITKKIIVKHKPIANFTANIVCQGSFTAFTNTSFIDSVSGVTWNWDFGDLITSTAENPGTHGYTSSGVYTAELIAVADNGCSDTINKQVTVSAYPSTNIYIDEGSSSFCIGNNVVLSCTNNPNYTYQWRLNGSNIGGQVFDTIYIDTTYDYLNTDEYSVQITNTIGNCVTVTDTQDVNVYNLPTSPSINVNGATTFCKDDSVILSVTNVPGNTYQWKDGNANIFGATSNSYIAKPTVSGAHRYNLEITNSNGCSSTSIDTVDVTVYDNPDILTISQIGSIDFCQGESVTLSVTNNADYTYQWKDGNSVLSNTDSNVYIATTSGDYSLEVTNTDGCVSVSSNNIEVTVRNNPTAPTITPLSATTFCQGDSLILSVPNNTAYNYQWYENNSPAGTGNTYRSKPVNGGSYEYTVIVELDSTACMVPSTDTIDVTVYSNPTQPTIVRDGDTTFCIGDSVILSITGVTGNTYQWYRGGSILTGSTNTSYTAKTTGTYNLQVTNTNGCMKPSENTLNVTVYSNPSIPIITQTGLTTFCSGDSIVLSVTNNPAYTYQWKNGVSIIDGAISNNYSAKATGNYMLEVTNASGCKATSASIAVTANPTPTIPTITQDGITTFCQGNSVTLSVTINLNNTYQWKDGINVITGSDSNIYIATTTGNYNLEVTNSYGCISTSSNTVTVTVNSNPTVPTIAQDGVTTFCQGDSVMLSVTNVTGNTYQWKTGASIIEGAEGNSYTAKATGTYNLEVTNSSSCISTSANTINVTVNEKPTSPTIIASTNNPVCEGSSISLSVPDNADYTYQWINGVNLIPATDSNEYVATTSGSYSLEVTNTSGCKASSSNTVLVTVNSNPAIPVISYTGATTFCSGDSLVLGVTNDPLLSYQWKATQEALNKNTTSTYTVNKTGNYFLTVSNANGCPVNSSDTITVVVNPAPATDDIALSEVKDAYCSDDTITLSVDSQTGCSYQWKKGGQNIAGATNNTYLPTGTGLYSLVISNPYNCDVAVAPVDITIYERPQVPVIDLATTTLEICPGEVVTLKPTEITSTYIYQWKKNGVPMDEGELSTLQLKLKAGDYSVVASVEECSSESNAITISYKESLPVPELSAFGPVLWYIACSNDSASLYRWYYNDVLIPDATESAYVAYQKLGKYYVEINDGYECPIQSEVILIPPDYTTGIETETVFGTIKIYPNPTPGLFSIEMDNNLYGELEIDINKENGSRVLLMEILKNQRHFITRVDLSAQGNGLYFIGFKFEKDYTVRKLIVE